MPKAVGERKVCSTCKEKKHISEFHFSKTRPDGLTYSCKECKNSRSKKWKKNNKDKVDKYNKQYKKEHKKELNLAWHKWAKNTNYHNKKKIYNQEIKNKFIEMYGGKCSCCGESRREFLTIEHIKGQAGLSKKEVGVVAYRKAVAKYQPNEYDLLCMNCNFSKGKFGYCPHDYER